MYDSYFLEKFLNFKDQLEKAGQCRNAPEGLNYLNTKDKMFCDLVVMKSRLLGGPAYQKLGVSNFCGVFRNDQEVNMFYWMYEFHLDYSDKQVHYTLAQFNNNNSIIHYYFAIDKKDFIDFLMKKFSYVDPEITLV